MVSPSRLSIDMRRDDNPFCFEGDLIRLGLRGVDGGITALSVPVAAGLHRPSLVSWVCWVPTSRHDGGWRRLAGSSATIGCDVVDFCFPSGRLT